MFRTYKNDILEHNPPYMESDLTCNSRVTDL